ncbi:MAG: biopolymer transporter ExbD [Myxococcales bacterium]|nr:biopolymer transporter ExbD [Myxococcales bacterium]
MNFRSAPSGLSRRAATVVDITALVDVVFQLLIFFLLTSSYVSQPPTPSDDPQVPVDLPEASLTAENQKVEDFTIVVDAEGQIFVGPESEQVTVEALANRLARVADANPATVVLIRGDERVRHGRIAQIMAVARMSRLRISVVLSDGG